tara:strand:+ start:772 stop:1179 length:408 start_codon:yes stop_codon:yes gene_type:complete
MTTLLNNSSIEIKVIKKCIYINIKNLCNIDENELNTTILYYKHIHKICYEHNLQFNMIIDFSNSEVSINAINYTKIFINLLTFINPISVMTIQSTFVIITNNITKMLINMILSIYKNSKPLYIINNRNDIISLTE